MTRRIGFALSGMNLGLLIAPFLAGAIYEMAGYYAVFAAIIGVILFAFILRVMTIEQRKAVKWLGEDRIDNSCPDGEGSDLEPNAPQQSSAESGLTNCSTEVVSTNGSSRTSEPPNEVSPLLRTSKRTQSWFSATFPALALLLSSHRLGAAVYGGFTHATLITSFDAVLPLLVNRTFGWRSTASGLTFLALTLPSLATTVVGALSDRYGTRKASLFGFAVAITSLALLGLIIHDSLIDKIFLCVLLVFIGKLTSNLTLHTLVS